MRHPWKKWTEKELQILRANWKEVSAKTLKKLLRGRKWNAIYRQAQNSGLPMGPPQGYELFAHACERTGFSNDGLKTILKRHKVSFWHGYSRYSVEASCHLYLDTYDVNHALDKELALESIRQAASRLNMSEQYLGKLLKLHGLSPGTGIPARYAPELYDQIAESRSKERAA